MIILDYRDTRPLYEQIVDKFQMLILSGALEPNSRMPSVRSLAVELSINPNTIQRAYSELERNGFLYTVKGKGNYVAYSDSLKDVRKQEILEKLRDLKKEALSMGMTVKELTEFYKFRIYSNFIHNHYLRLYSQREYKIFIVILFSVCRFENTGTERSVQKHINIFIIDYLQCINKIFGIKSNRKLISVNLCKYLFVSCTCFGIRGNYYIFVVNFHLNRNFS